MSEATGEIHYFPDDKESEYNMLTRMSIALQTYSLIVTLQSMLSHASSVVSNGAIVDFHYGSLLPSFCEENSNSRWWSELSLHEQQHCTSRGWTEDICEERWDWEEPSVERQIYWISQGISQNEWVRVIERQQYYIQQNITTDTWEKDMSWDEMPFQIMSCLMMQLLWKLVLGKG